MVFRLKFLFVLENEILALICSNTSSIHKRCGHLGVHVAQLDAVFLLESFQLIPHMFNLFELDG